MEEEKQEKGFVIKDRRHFDETGSVRPEEEARQAEPKREEKSVPTPPPQEGPTPPLREESTGKDSEGPTQTPTEETSLPEINFANFIFSLSTTAMYHFGDIPDPVTGEARKNLPAAKQTIDILTILRAKTEGNLDEGEKELLDGVLFELRMRFVKEMKNK